MIKVLAHSDDIDVKQTRSAVHPFSLIKENENKVFFSETNKKIVESFFSVCRLLGLGKVFFLLTISYFLTDYRHIKSDIYDFLIQIYAKRWAIFTRIFMQSRLM